MTLSKQGRVGVMGIQVCRCAGFLAVSSIGESGDGYWQGNW